MIFRAFDYSIQCFLVISRVLSSVIRHKDIRRRSMCSECISCNNDHCESWHDVSLMFSIYIMQRENKCPIMQMEGKCTTSTTLEWLLQCSISQKRKLTFDQVSQDQKPDRWV